MRRISKSKLKNYYSLIISDVHLGAKVLNYEKLLWVLNNIKFDRLIINGDLFDDGLNLHRLNTEHWTVLSKIRELTKTKMVIFCIGNHDANVGPIIDLIGANNYKDYVFYLNHKKFIVTHGDLFDFYIRYKPLLTWAATGIYYFIQKFGGKKQIFSTFLKRKSKEVLKIHEKLRSRAIKFAENHGAQVIICGHSHIADQCEHDGVSYINSGSFCDKICHYITIDDKGNYELKEI